MARYHKYHNEWILANKDKFFSWSDMCKEYNKVFGTEIERVRFKNHCSDDLKLRLENYNYTEEQKGWLVEHYPKYGAKKTASEFNRIFGQSRSEHSIKNICVGKLGVQLNEEAFKRYRKETTDVLITYNKSKAVEVGTVGRLTNGYYMVKMQDGSWEYAGKRLYKDNVGEVPNGYQVIFLDGNKNNINLDNLAVVPVEYQALMNTHKLRSENPTITETAIVWCDLYTALDSEVIT